MTPEQHVAEAEKCLEYAKGYTNGYSEKATAWATIATAHAAIAQAKQGAKR